MHARVISRCCLGVVLSAAVAIAFPQTTAGAELLVNGNFDAGPGLPWLEDSGGWGPVILDQANGLPVEPFTGAFAAWLGGIDAVTMTLSQDVSVPAQATGLRLQGYLRMATEEYYPFDTLEIEITTTSGAPLELLLRWNCTDGYYATWTLFSVDASSAYAGQTIRLHIRAYCDPSLSTSFFLDSLTLQATVPTDVACPAVTALRLHPNQPNPFNPLTTLRFDVPLGGRARLDVYDVAGRLIRVLVEGERAAGSHEAVWDGRDSAGRAMASGSYFARLEAGDEVETVRMSLVR